MNGQKLLVNSAAVRSFVMDRAQAMGRGDVITRVGSDVLVHLDSLVRQRLVRMIERHPSAFKTLKIG